MDSAILKKRRVSHTISEKKKALKELLNEGGNVAGTAKKLGISRRCLRDWKRESKKINNKENTKDRVTYRLRKPVGKFSELEEKLYEWVLIERLNSHTISYSDVRNKAKNMVRDQSFKGSDHWVNNFMKRYHLSV